MNTFDPLHHVYTIDGQPVPSVTQVLSAMVPQWQPDDPWYMERGTAVHAAGALIAYDDLGEFDPVIAPQVEACRLFYKDFRPVVRHVEEPVYSKLYRFAGTLDLGADITGKPTLIDWKGSLPKSVQWQLGAYSIAARETLGTNYKTGFGVELRNDGTYKKGETYDLVRAGREFLGFLTAFNSMKREGYI
jgi:hypothetical protein